jgi:hypothetical protein
VEKGQRKCRLSRAAPYLRHGGVGPEPAESEEVIEKLRRIARPGPVVELGILIETPLEPVFFCLRQTARYLPIRAY